MGPKNITKEYQINANQVTIITKNTNQRDSMYSHCLQIAKNVFMADILMNHVTIIIENIKITSNQGTVITKERRSPQIKVNVLLVNYKSMYNHYRKLNRSHHTESR